MSCPPASAAPPEPYPGHDPGPLSRRWCFRATGTRWQLLTASPLSSALRTHLTALVADFEDVWSRFRPDSLIRRAASWGSSFILICPLILHCTFIGPALTLHCTNTSVQMLQPACVCALLPVYARNALSISGTCSATIIPGPITIRKNSDCIQYIYDT